MSNALYVVAFFGTLASDDYCTKHLDNQLAWHVKYGLPRPPADASLVWYVTEPTTYYQHRKKIVEPGSPGLGFTLDGRTVLGYLNRSDSVASVTSVKPDPSLVRDDVYINWLQLAIACYERGWKPLALAALRKWVLVNGWDTEQYVARGAWYHWERRIHEDTGTPLPVIAKYLKRALPLGGPDNEHNRELIRSIELAVKPRHSLPDSDNALIDELIGLSGERPFGVCWVSGYRLDPRYQALAKRGFDAVPALIAHLKDERITRAICRLEGLENIQNLRVKDLVLDLLAQLHGGPFVGENNTHAIVKAVGEWYAEAHKLGEGKYIASRILGEEEDDREFRATLFALLTEKYPERVPDVFRELIDTRTGQYQFAWEYAKAVAEGPLPVADKRKILEYAASKDSPRLRASAIRYLRTVDPKLAHEILLTALANVPTMTDEVDACFACVAAERANATEWKALRLAVRRADPGGRLELLRMVSRATAPEGRKHRLALLAEYLTDDAVRDADTNRHRFQWSRVAGDGFPQLEVRNFAALRLSLLLKLEVEADRDWTAAQWAALREKVSAKVKEELRR